MRQYQLTLFTATLLMLLALPMAALADKGIVRITTSPGDAKIYVDGKRKGSTPSQAGQSFAIQLGEGEYKIEAVKAVDDYNEKYGTKDIFVAEDTVQAIDLDLKSRLTEAGKVREAKRP
ncbi:PEGA domain-containing protein [Ectothiorhodospiraceae bacterium BW-2]|nr:PEGA domain-containing protein [Ectothiorhodospiraceae bacterium BW-2]